MDKLTPEQRRKNMRAIKSSGSKIEKKLAKALWSRGFRYRKNNPKVIGKPDFTFAYLKIAIFVDSEFWHGKDWENRKLDHKSNIDFWHKKITGNIQRDIKVNSKLKNEGWTVLRFWGNEINMDLDKCVETICQSVNAKRVD